VPTSVVSRRTSSRRLPRAAAVAAVTLAVVGGAIAVAPTASAVGHSGCTSLDYYWHGHVNTGGVNLRSGPGTSYSSKGLLSAGNKLTYICYKEGTATTWSWDYVKVTSGAHAGTYGWVYDKYVDIDM
jgi:uncharacterized protein YgiM (DUF1202 family)